MAKVDLTIGIGGEAGQGIATPGDMLTRIFARRGLNVETYNAYQSLIRGGHIFLTIRTSDGPVHSIGDKYDILVCFNQNTMDRHLKLMGKDTYVLYDGEKVKPGQAAQGVHMCPLPIKELTGDSKNKLAQNSITLGVICKLMGVDFKVLEDVIALHFEEKGEEMIKSNVAPAHAGYEYAAKNYKAFSWQLPITGKKLAITAGNDALAMGGAAAGVKFYCAYPMSPSTGVLHWMAKHARKLDIMVRQVEDEIGVINMAVGASFAGCRVMCATSGGGFALMTEGIGAAAMMELPLVVVDVMRGGPATGLPTKTEQGDLWQAFGAGQGDYPRLIVAPTNILDCFKTVPELFNLVDKLQCPGIILTDLLVSEGRGTIDPNEIEWNGKIDRGEMIFPNGKNKAASPFGGYNDSTFLRYKNTDSGVSPRAVPGTPGFIHHATTDEHDEDSTLISDENTNPAKRRMMVEKRARKMELAFSLVAPPKLTGPENAQVTLIGWGATQGVIQEAIEKLAAQGVVANQLAIKWLVPFHAEEVKKILSKSKKVIIVENNYSGQFARFLRSETGIEANGHIRKYDGEPFMPHHIVDAVKEQLTGKTKLSVPVHEIMV